VRAWHASEVDRDEYGDDEAAFVQHLDSLGVPHPYGSQDARRLGLDRNTEEGALLAFGSALQPDRTMHRVVAWILLAAFGLPALFAVLHFAEEALALLMP
jgi:hypothetical protein